MDCLFIFYLIMVILVSLLIIFYFEKRKRKKKIEQERQAERRRENADKRKQAEMQRDEAIAKERQAEINRRKEITEKEKQAELQRQEIEQKNRKIKLLHNFLMIVNELRDPSNVDQRKNDPYLIKQEIENKYNEDEIFFRFDFFIDTIEIDLHKLTLKEAMAFYSKLIGICEGYRVQLKVIHGYRHGTAIRDYIRDAHFECISLIEEDLSNEGVTHIKICNEKCIIQRLENEKQSLYALLIEEGVELDNIILKYEKIKNDYGHIVENKNREITRIKKVLDLNFSVYSIEGLIANDISVASYINKINDIISGCTTEKHQIIYRNNIFVTIIKGSIKETVYIYDINRKGSCMTIDDNSLTVYKHNT